MSQIDKVIYVPLLLWFGILFVILYFIFYCFVIYYFWMSLSVRNRYFDMVVVLFIGALNTLSYGHLLLFPEFKRTYRRLFHSFKLLAVRYFKKTTLKKYINK